MNSQLEDLINGMNQTKSDFLAELDQWDESMLTSHAYGKWNAIQVMEHAIIIPVPFAVIAHLLMKLFQLPL